MIKRSIVLIGLIFSFWLSYCSAQAIVIDESYTDWSSDDLILDDTGDPFLGFDVEQLYVANDQEYLFIRLDLSQEIQLQDGSNIAIRIDIDNDINTGFEVNGIGSEITFFLGDRFGFLNTNTSSLSINHADIGLVVAPTVSSDIFELAIRRNNSFSGIDFNMQSDIRIRIEHNGNIGDQLPNDDGGLLYTFKELSSDAYLAPLVRTTATDYRLLSYNIEFDQLLDQDRFDPFRNILKSINPDIIAFQELFDSNATEVRETVAQMLGDDPSEWYIEKRGFGTALMSKYPILFDDSVDANSAYVVDLGVEELMIINGHLPCCEKDAERREEIDAILAYVRDLRNGVGAYELNQDSPIIFCGDMNMVGLRDQVDNILSGNINNNNVFGPDLEAPIFTDLKPKTTGLPMSFTWYNSFGSYFPGRLDYVFYTDQIRVENSFSLFSEALTQDQLQDFQLERFNTEEASDHLPVVFDFRFPNSVSSEDSSIDILSHSYSIYPNPTEDILYLSDKNDLLGTINVYTATGRLVYSSSHKGNKTILNLASLEGGLYIVERLFNKGRRMQSKIVVR